MDSSLLGKRYRFRRQRYMPVTSEIICFFSSENTLKLIRFLGLNWNFLQRKSTSILVDEFYKINL